MQLTKRECIILWMFLGCLTFIGVFGGGLARYERNKESELKKAAAICSEYGAHMALDVELGEKSSECFVHMEHDIVLPLNKAIEAQLLNYKMIKGLE